jgi:hypothetical protein
MVIEFVRHRRRGRRGSSPQGIGVVDHAASCSKGRHQARLDVLASDGHVHVHRVP